jgi:uncharacterized integral membrane protein
MATDKTRDMGSRIRLAVTVVVLVVLAIFILRNFEKVNVDLVVGSQNIQLAFALILAALLGFVAGFFVPRGR